MVSSSCFTFQILVDLPWWDGSSLARLPEGTILLSCMFKSVATGMKVMADADSIRYNAGARIDGVVAGIVMMISPASSSVIAGGATGATTTTGVGGRR